MEAAVEKIARTTAMDSDHDPFGVKQERRAVQLGLGGEVLRSHSRDSLAVSCLARRST
jgi:hypothetical protein